LTGSFQLRLACVVNPTTRNAAPIPKAIGVMTERRRLARAAPAPLDGEAEGPFIRRGLALLLQVNKIF
jgi:hypothetical protein